MLLALFSLIGATRESVLSSAIGVVSCVFSQGLDHVRDFAALLEALSATARNPCVIQFFKGRIVTESIVATYFFFFLTFEARLVWGHTVAAAAGLLAALGLAETVLKISGLNRDDESVSTRHGAR